MREATHGSLRTDVFEKGEVLRVSCPCCKKRLFDLEMDSEVGNETIRIKCSRCIRLSEKIHRRCGCDKPGNWQQYDLIIWRIG